MSEPEPAGAANRVEIRGAVLDGPGVPTRIETLLLDAPGPGEVRVRMAAAGVCHSDLHVRDGEWERDGPIVLGHEGSAVVEALGDGVAAAFPGLRPGVLVALSWLIPCGRCRACRAGRAWSCSDSPSTPPVRRYTSSLEE
jgi:S-(hydroxymethyl)glutathione dehydrogenase/alcohol dehydrogenase